MVAEYRKSSHTIYKVELHIAWITKYRYKVLKGDIGTRTRDLIRRICNEENVDIISGSVSPDHVHILVSIDPKISISKLLKFLKGKTSRKLQIEFPELRKKYWGQHLWARGYFVVSTGNVTTEMISEYIKHHFENKESPHDPFRVESA
ncbi:MAG: IS200/IS605 family transposase [Candidatus Pacebacteria bacterium]|nr:IS200/IS605 family transposase [Candidatus Paceibacterota bacterium]